MPRAAAAVLFILVLAGCGGAGGSSHSSSATTSSGKAKQVAERTRKTATTRKVPALIPPPNPRPRTVRVPVLTWHRVVPMPAVGEPDLIVDPSVFAAELKALHDNGYHPISQAQLFDALYKGAALPPKPVIISVDDGYVDDVRAILPALKRWHMVATFFVITGRTHEPGFVTATQIRELDRAGMDVGDHTTHHLDLRVLPPAELKAETAGSRHMLQKILGHPTYWFAYPYGEFNDQVVAAVRAAGFTMAYTTESGTAQSSQAPLTMPRLHVSRDTTPSGLIADLGGQ